MNAPCNGEEVKTSLLVVVVAEKEAISYCDWADSKQLDTPEVAEVSKTTLTKDKELGIDVTLLHPKTRGQWLAALWLLPIGTTAGCETREISCFVRCCRLRHGPLLSRLGFEFVLPWETCYGFDWIELDEWEQWK